MVTLKTLLQEFGFLSKTIHESLDMVDWVARYAYEFENITYAYGMSFSNPCAFHARSFYEEKICDFLSFCDLYS